MSDQCIVAIDQGTTGSTVLVLDHAGSVRGRAYSEFTQHYPKPGWVEHDAEELWIVTRGVVEAALRDAGIGPENVQAIGIANQRETSLLWHRTDGRPEGRAIVWQDRRTSSLCDELKQEGLEPAWQEKTGLLIDPYFSATKIRWMLDHVEGLPARCANGDMAFGTIDSFVLMNTGGQPVASRERLLTTIAWGIGEEPVEYALEGAIFITGAAIQWLRDGLGIIADAAESEDLATAVDGNDDSMRNGRWPIATSPAWTLPNAIASIPVGTRR